MEKVRIMEEVIEMALPIFEDLTRPRRVGRFVTTEPENEPGLICIVFRPAGILGLILNRTERIRNVPEGALIGPFTGPDFSTDGNMFLIQSEGGYKGALNDIQELIDQRLPDLKRRNIKLELKASAAVADRELSERAEKEKISELSERLSRERRPRPSLYPTEEEEF